MSTSTGCSNVWVDPSKIEPDDVKRILEYCQSLELYEGEVGSEEGENFGVEKYIRRCLVGDVENPEIFDLCDAIFSEANEMFGFDLDRCKEVNYVEYHGHEDSLNEAGFYDWHMDIEEFKYSRYERKLSLSIQLSESTEYEGCSLQFGHVDEDPDQKDLGSAIVFPSYFSHTVEPCTKGVRKCLVAWSHGPLFR